jgi:hypothetical protein
MRTNEEHDSATTTLQLSPHGRQEFGNWLANRLVIVSGSMVALVLVPGLAGKMNLPGPVSTAGWFAAGLLVISAGAIKYFTVERVDEIVAGSETSDG